MVGEIALLSALCMFFKASGKTWALSYQFPFNWLFTLCLSLLTSSLFLWVCWNIVSLCSVTKALIMIIQSRECGRETVVGAKHSTILCLGIIVVTPRTVVMMSSDILYSRWAGLSSCYGDASSSFLPRQTKPKPVLKMASSAIPVCPSFIVPLLYRWHTWPPLL